MLYNYIKGSIRILHRNKLTSLINIGGLALAITCVLLIVVYVLDEFSYDKHFKHADSIYRVTRNFISKEGNVTLHLSHTAPAIAPLMKNDFSDVENYCRLYKYSNLLVLEEEGRILKSFEEQEMFMAEPAFLTMFTVPFLEGNPATALSAPFKVVLSETTAKRYFGSESPIGKTLKLGDTYPVEVTGVFKSFPKQTHFHPEILISFSSMEDESIYGKQALASNWGNNAFISYILVNDQIDAQRMEEQFPAFIDKHYGNYARGIGPVPDDWIPSKATTLFLQKVIDIHLHSQLDSELETNGSIRSVYTLSIIGCIILAIACFNFINLSTAQATKRLKEVGVRKALGALPGDLMVQVLIESILVVLFAFLIACILIGITLPAFNNFAQKEMVITDFFSVETVALAILFTIGLGVLAGAYPALFTAKWKPVLALKGYQPAGTGKVPVRKVLVVIQFASAVALIISSAVIIHQLDYLRRASLGYNKNHILTVGLDPIQNQYDAFFNDATQSPHILNLTRSSRYPTGRLLDYLNSAVQRGDSLVPTQQPLKLLSVDYEFFDTYEIPLVEGRNFDRSIPTDDSVAFIVNEVATKMLGWNSNLDAIGKELMYANVRGRIIGVCKDFHFETLKERITPMIFYIKPVYYNYVSVKLDANSIVSGLAELEQRWKKYALAYPFDYNFLEGQYERLYSAEERQSQLVVVFTLLAIGVACLGLFGLTTFSAVQRVKEIGIRKVLGASVGRIVMLLFSEVLVLVVIANAIAIPVAWYIMSDWLNSFAYRISLSPGIILLTMSVTVTIAFFTVFYTALKAARANPIQSIGKNQ